MELTYEQEACVLRGARLVSDTDRDEYFSLISTYLKSLREISIGMRCRVQSKCYSRIVSDNGGVVQDDRENELREIEAWRQAVRESILRSGRKRRRRGNNNSASRDATDKGSDESE